MTKNCEYCLYADKCDKNEKCEYFAATDEDEYIVINELTDKSGKYITNHAEHSRYIKDGDESSLYEYHSKFINETLQDIRAGMTGYVFTEEQVHIIGMYEPNIHIILKDGIYYITKENN